MVQAEQKTEHKSHSSPMKNTPVRHTKLQMPKFKLIPKRPHYSYPKITIQPSTLPNYSTTNSHPNDNLATPHDTLINTSVTTNTDTPIRIYSRVNYPFPPPSS